MKHLRVLLVVLLAVGAVAGCGAKSDTGSGTGTAATTAAAPSPTPPAPKDALLASVTTFDTTPYAFHLKQPDTVAEGKVDPANKSAVVSINGKVSGQTVALGYTMIGPDLWMKIDLGAANSQLHIDKTKWMHIDQTKVKDKTALLPLDANGAFAVGTKDMLAGMAGLQSTDATHISGTVDVTNANSLLSPDKDVLTKVGDKAKTVPFTAVLDDKGRLADLKVDGATIDPGLVIDVTFDSFGTITPITKPTGAIQAPASLYTSLFAG